MKKNHGKVTLKAYIQGQGMVLPPSLEVMIPVDVDDVKPYLGG
jgi:hypothetical protein